MPIAKAGVEETISQVPGLLVVEAKSALPRPEQVGHVGNCVVSASGGEVQGVFAIWIEVASK